MYSFIDVVFFDIALFSPFFFFLLLFLGVVGVQCVFMCGMNHVCLCVGCLVLQLLLMWVLFRVCMYVG